MLRSSVVVGLACLLACSESFRPARGGPDLADAGAGMRRDAGTSPPDGRRDGGPNPPVRRDGGADGGATGTLGERLAESLSDDASRRCRCDFAALGFDSAAACTTETTPDAACVAEAVDEGSEALQAIVSCLLPVYDAFAECSGEGCRNRARCEMEREEAFGRCFVEADPMEFFTLITLVETCG